MPVEYLSVEQEARYGRFAAEPVPGELERFFRLDAKALESARAKRRATTRLGWAVPWGTVRMLGTFLTEEPTSVPASVVAFVAGQLGEDAEHFAGYGARQQTPYEHAWEGRDACGYRDFAAGEDELREFLAARVWSSLEGPRALFDRAVVWLIGSQVLLPGITTLARMVAEVRQEENDRLYATLYRVTPDELRTEMARLLEVPEKRRVSELERLRLGPMRISGRAMEYALERTQQVRDLGAGKVDVAQVPAARLTGLARYGLASKAPTLKRLEVTRQTATLLATVRHLETATVDDALDLLDALMASKLLAKAERLGKDAELKTLPRLRKAAKKVAAAVDVLMGTAPATEDGDMVSVTDAWSAIEKVVPREQLAAALAVIAEMVPDDDGGGDGEWRRELVARYGTVGGFIKLLVEVIDFGAAGTGNEVVKALRQLPGLIGRKKIGAEEIARDLVTGSWRRLVFADPVRKLGPVDKAAYSFCVLELLHRSLRRRDIFAKDGDRWGARAPSCYPATAGRPRSRRCSPRWGWRQSQRRTWPRSPPSCTPRTSRLPPGCQATPRCRSREASSSWTRPSRNNGAKSTGTL